MNRFRTGWERGGPRGYRAREPFFARCAELPAADPSDRARIREQTAPLGFREHDWRLSGR